MKIKSLGITSETEDQTQTEYLENYISDSIVYDDSKYTVKLPWRDDRNCAIKPRSTLIQNRECYQETENLKTLLTKYREIISDQEKRGFIEKVDPQSTDETVHYIPHHSVKKDSATTAICIVYNGSCCQSKDIISLNKPPILNNISSLLLHFR